MPRTLSGLKTGDFDTLEVADKFEAKGEMIHSGETAPEFAWCAEVSSGEFWWIWMDGLS
eukprot:COSAG04_NODE_190_length_20948_cov_7.298863_7_plen_59_part_00